MPPKSATICRAGAASGIAHRQQQAGERKGEQAGGREDHLPGPHHAEDRQADLFDVLEQREKRSPAEQRQRGADAGAEGVDAKGAPAAHWVRRHP